MLKKRYNLVNIVAKYRSRFYMLFVMMMLLMCWETSMMNAALAANSIPSEAIRIRILANSDSLEDQWVKGEIRKTVTASVGGWLQDSANIDEARADIQAHLPELQQIVMDRLNELGYSYESKAELGKVPFPAKVFGNEVYPEGEYEALRITLGKGQGANWWCVLYPPLCFFGIGKSDKSTDSTGDTSETLSKTSSDVEKKDADVMSSSAKEAVDNVEVRFFLVDLFNQVTAWFKG